MFGVLTRQFRVRNDSLVKRPRQNPRSTAHFAQTNLKESAPRALQFRLWVEKSHTETQKNNEGSHEQRYHRIAMD